MPDILVGFQRPAIRSRYVAGLPFLGHMVLGNFLFGLIALLTASSFERSHRIAGVTSPNARLSFKPLTNPPFGTEEAPSTT